MSSKFLVEVINNQQEIRTAISAATLLVVPVCAQLIVAAMRATIARLESRVAQGNAQAASTQESIEKLDARVQRIESTCRDWKGENE